MLATVIMISCNVMSSSCHCRLYSSGSGITLQTAESPWSKKARRALASVAVRSSSPAREFDPRDNLWEINTLNSERTLLLRVPRKWSLHALFSVLFHSLSDIGCRAPVVGEPTLKW